MNLAQVYIGMKETIAYYKLEPHQISAIFNPYCGKWMVYENYGSTHCGMTPEKFIRITTGDGTIDHEVYNEQPIFHNDDDCYAACRLLHIYLYHRDYS